MYSVTRLIHFCYGHRLLDYQGKCRYLHGHNGRAEIELSSTRLDQRGMVRDFEEINQTIQTWIERSLDHKMLLHRKDPVITALRRLGEPMFLMASNPTAEAIAELIFHYAVSQGLPVTSVRLWETDRSVATYSLDSPRRSGARSGLRLATARTDAAWRGRRTSRRARTTSTAA